MSEIYQDGYDQGLKELGLLNINKQKTVKRLQYGQKIYQSKSPYNVFGKIILLRKTK